MGRLAIVSTPRAQIYATLNDVKKGPAVVGGSHSTEAACGFTARHARQSTATGVDCGE